MRRRDFMLAAAVPALGALGLPGLWWAGATGQRGAVAQEAETSSGTPFEAQTVREMARKLASADYKSAERKLPPELDKLSYDDYRNIRFNTDRSIWRGTDAPFELQLFHRGFLFRDRVDIAIVADGEARPLPYSQDYFRFEHGLKPPDPKLDLGYAGFRIHAPLNRPDYLDEVAAFQGASYFRAVGKGQGYGSSARGLALKTADAAGEEFPLFKAFWIERPRPGSGSMVVHALLDSPSASAAYRFTIDPGDTTTMTVEMTLYPRVDIDKAGIAPLTSMFFFGPNDRDGIDDFRPAVRDADGLSILNGRGELVWRPLSNPQRLQVSAFGDANIRGFGLMQRQRSFFDYQDLEARYERRPSVWVEPIGDWGDGAVHLVEIPTPEEVHDNIVTYWRPKDPLRKGGDYRYTYRLHWGWDGPATSRLARFGDTRTGGTAERRQFVIDIVGADPAEVPPDSLRPDVGTSAGSVRDVVLQPHPDIKGYRLSFSLEPGGADLAELSARLYRGDAAASETWVYRWTP